MNHHDDPTRNPMRQMVMDPAVIASDRQAAEVEGKRREPAAQPAPPVTAARAAMEPFAPTRYALFIAHGMGQQVPFETIDLAARGAMRGARIHGDVASVGDEVRTRTVRIGEQTLQRAEFDVRIKGREGAPEEPVEVHIYEGYWAAYTEGVVKLRDVVGFLFRGAWNGARNSFREVKRYMFAMEAPLRRSELTAFYFFLAGLVISSLYLINALIAFVAATRVFTTSQKTTWPDNDLLSLLTLIAALLIIVIVSYGVLLGAQIFLRARARKRGRSEKLARSLASFLWFAFWLAALSLVLAALAFAVVMIVSRLDWVEGKGSSIISGLVGSLPLIEQWRWVSTSGGWIAVWGLLVALSGAIRQMLIQFPGDVAAYISSHKLDRFNELRDKIKTTVFTTLDAVYAARESGRPYYDKVALIGHSLGSVVTYDALNNVINNDELDGNTRDVLGRTAVLVTFGSPLDKTAYIFGVQGKSTTSIRERLATSKQPLIQDYAKYRRFPWYNIHSRRDIVAGSLDYYDCADADDFHAAKAVQNIEDPAAYTPLAAHVEYWEGDLVWTTMWDGLMEESGIWGRE